MVMAMTATARPHRTERLADASVVTAVADIAGARHEVLPPRRRNTDGLLVLQPTRLAPP